MLKLLRSCVHMNSPAITEDELDGEDIRKNYYFILLQDSLAERRERNVILRRNQSEQSEALKGSLLYLTPQEFKEMSSARNRSLQLKIHSAESSDLRVSCQLSFVEKLTNIEYHLLVTVPSLKDRITAYHERIRLQKAGEIFQLFRQASKERKTPPMQKVQILDEREDVLSGMVKYVGKVPGRSGIWFAIELDSAFRSVEKFMINGNFDDKQLFTVEPGSGMLISFRKIHLFEDPLTETPPQAEKIVTDGTGQTGSNFDSGVVENELLLSGRSSQRSTATVSSATTSTCSERSANNTSSQEDKAVDNEVYWLSKDDLPRPNLKIGDRVVWPSDTGLEPGSVRWIGVLKDSPNYYTIGVEFDNPIGTGTGQYKGCQLFQAQQKHASLVAVDGLIRADEFYGENHAENHGENHGQIYDETDCGTSVDLSGNALAYQETSVSNVDHRPRLNGVQSSVTPAVIDPAVEVINNQIHQPEAGGLHSYPRSETAGVLGADFELGSMVEIEVAAGGLMYGVVRWLGHLKEHDKPMVGVELEEDSIAGTDGKFGYTRLFTCPPRRGYFAYLHRVKRDRRFMDCREGGVQHEFGSMECRDVEGSYRELCYDDSRQLQPLLGRYRGIQGHHNSCYMDAVLFSMFAFTTSFDSLLYRKRNNEDIARYEEMQKCLLESIVNPLRTGTHFVRADKVLKLRTLLDECSSIKGFQCEEKDPEEFLSSLLDDTLKAQPFIKFSSGQSSHSYQLFVDADQTPISDCPTIQQLLDISFNQSNIRLKEVPSCLILQMPRFGKERIFQRVIPNLTINITHLLQSENISENHDEVQSDSSKRRRISETPVEEMELFAIVCIDTSHYVTIAKCAPGLDAPWVFFDSMADRIGEEDGYNVPEITECPYLPSLLQGQANVEQLVNTSDIHKFEPQVRRILRDAYICLYQSPSMSQYR